MYENYFSSSRACGEFFSRCISRRKTRPRPVLHNTLAVGFELRKEPLLGPQRCDDRAYYRNLLNQNKGMRSVSREYFSHSFAHALNSARVRPRERAQNNKKTLTNTMFQRSTILKSSVRGVALTTAHKRTTTAYAAAISNCLLMMFSQLVRKRWFYFFVFGAAMR